MKLRSALIAAASVFAIANAHASNINVSTGFTNAGPQATATDYQNAVNTAVSIATPGYGSTAVALYDGVSNQSLFGGPATNIAFRSIIDFGVTAGNVGTWAFRFGVDFGWGGTVFLDGVAQATNSADMWWAGSYSNPSQFLSFSSALAAGNHQIAVYGMEGCCDGGQQAQFLAPNANGYVTFGSNDGIAPIPEPETYAMLLAGLGVMGAVARRRKQV